jgi:hypothetical protein
MSYSNEDYGTYEEGEQVPFDSRAADKTNLPGMFLIMVGVVNLLAALYLGINGVLAMMLPAEQFERMYTEEQKKQFQEVGLTLEQLKDISGAICLIGGAFVLVAAFVTIAGGARMRALKSYGLAMTGSLLAAIPCISPLGCCLVGEVVGLWALLVLMSADVRSAFS